MGPPTDKGRDPSVFRVAGPVLIPQEVLFAGGIEGQHGKTELQGINRGPAQPFVNLGVIVGEGEAARSVVVGSRHVDDIAAAGAGVPGGQVIGSSDAQGGAPKDRPISVEDIGATLYKELGIDYHKEYRTIGRPVKINSEGTPIRELFA